MSEKYSMKKSRMTLEILENISADSSKNHISQLAFLKQDGYKLAIFIHNESVAKKVKSLGIDYAQGYYYSIPNLWEA